MKPGKWTSRELRFSISVDGMVKMEEKEVESVLFPFCFDFDEKYMDHYSYMGKIDVIDLFWWSFHVFLYF